MFEPRCSGLTATQRGAQHGCCRLFISQTVGLHRGDLNTWLTADSCLFVTVFSKCVYLGSS